MDKRTIIVLGVPRSGTSMVAGIMRILGVYMGERIKPDKHEDLDFLWQSIEHIKETVEKRNRELSAWGWKDPNCAKYIWEVLPMLWNPHFVYVHRENLDAIVSELNRNAKTTPRRVIMRNRRFTRAYDTLAKQYPCLNLRYNDVVDDPERWGSLLGEFVGLAPERAELDKIAGFVKPGRYRRLMNS